MEQILQFAGRLHPMVLHAPIGLAIGLILIETLGFVRRKPVAPEVRWALAWAAALSAVASATSGLLLQEEGYSSDTVELHQWLGIATAAVMLAMAISQQVKKIKVYAGTLFLSGALLVPTGHFGASVTHGADFLTEPFDPPATLMPRVTIEGPEVPATGTMFASVIQPILTGSCVGCHGAERKKGGLALHTSEALFAGGDNDDAIVPGNAAESDLVRRLKLPVEDDEHMPPKAKPQLSAEQIKAIEDWINAGASLTSAAPATGAGEAGAPNAVQTNASGVKRASAAEAAPADMKAVEAVRNALVHIEPVARGSALLVVNASAVAPTIDDAACAKLLEPLREQIADLTLARTAITDSTMGLIARMPRLRRLDVAATHVTDSGVASLSGHGTIEEIVLSQTGVTAAIGKTLKTLPKLRQVFLWKTAVNSEDAKALRGESWLVRFDLGDSAPAEALEVEKELKFGKEAEEPAISDKAIVLKPVNTECPVTGKPVDPEYAIVFKGKVVGFCCRHCLGQFLEEPAKFEGKIK